VGVAVDLPLPKTLLEVVQTCLQESNVQRWLKGSTVGRFQLRRTLCGPGEKVSACHLGAGRTGQDGDESLH
jgi:hypothetical protein